LHTTIRIRLADGIEPCWSQWLCIDIDQHGDGDFSESNFNAAKGWALALKAFGFHPLLIDSNGKGGFHLYVFFDQPIITSHVRQLGRWLTRDWRERGLNGPPEVFPKQPEIALEGDGSFGNWTRLFGRHHKHDHWSQVLDLEHDEWLAND